MIREHGLKKVVLIAHEGCGYYKDVWTGMQTVIEQQAEDLRRAAEQIRYWSTGVVEISCYFARNLDGRVTFEKWAASRGERI